MPDQTQLIPQTAAFSLSHVADRSWCYPGETVTLHTRVTVKRAVRDLSVRLSVPPGFKVTTTEGELLFMNDARFVRWRLDEVQAGQRVDYQLPLVAAPTADDLSLDCEAVAIAGDESAVATATISVEAKSRYLKYLPAIYSEQDELMARFLMLFESFWNPIEQQIDLIPNYFDPHTAPTELLPWLATWVDLSLNDQWPEDKRRHLIRQAVSLYRKRGTKYGLREYLEIYTGRAPEIVELRGVDFKLGLGARLGPSNALGHANEAHTFIVNLKLPPLADRAETERRRMIEAIIESEKPAHTKYRLNIDHEPSAA